MEQILLSVDKLWRKSMLGRGKLQGWEEEYPLWDSISEEEVAPETPQRNQTEETMSGKFQNEASLTTDEEHWRTGYRGRVTRERKEVSARTRDHQRQRGRCRSLACPFSLLTMTWFYCLGATLIKVCVLSVSLCSKAPAKVTTYGESLPLHLYNTSLRKRPVLKPAHS